MENQNRAILGNHPERHVLHGLGRSLPYKMIPSPTERTHKVGSIRLFRGIYLKRK